MSEQDWDLERRTRYGTVLEIHCEECGEPLPVRLPTDGNCADCGMSIRAQHPDYDPTPCCSGVATGGPSSCNCHLPYAENH